MKKTLILLLILFLGVNSISKASYVGSPGNYTVFQRNGNAFTSTAEVIVTGTLIVSANAQYQIEKLDQFGTQKSIPYTYRALSNGTTGLVIQNIPNQNGAEPNYFKFKITLPTGWYRITIKDGNGSFSNTRKFGIGEVFVIAGQSNAAGEGSTQKIGTELNYDCVVSAKGGIGNTNGDYGYIFGGGIYMGTVHSDNKIFPMGSRAWFYQELGNKIASSSSTPTSSSLTNVVPVAFFNCALSGSSIQTWKTSLDRVRTIHNNSYVNPFINNWSSETTSQYSSWGQQYNLRDPYLGFQTILSYCANIFGIRAVLWHQGEAETKMLLSKLYSSTSVSPKIKYTNVKWNGDQEFAYYNSYDVGNYKTNLNAIISDTRSILGSNLVWAIGKVSLISETYVGDAIVDSKSVKSGVHTDIISASNNLTIPSFFNNAPTGKSFNILNSVIQEQEYIVANTSNVVWASEGSDNLKSDKRTPIDPATNDFTHFNSSGLSLMATDYYNHMANIFTKTPILSRTTPFISSSQSGSVYTLTSTSDYPLNYFVWGSGFDRASVNQSSSKSVTSGFVGYLYAKDATGRIYISNLVRVGNLSGLRRAVKDDFVVFPNPAQDTEILKLNLETTTNEKIQILVTDETGNVIDEIEQHEIGSGKWTYELSLPKQNFTDNRKMVYVSVVRNNVKTTERVLLTQ